MLLGNPLVTANNQATSTIQIQGRLRDYLRLLMGHPVLILDDDLDIGSQETVT